MQSFMKSDVCETGISNDQEMIIPVLGKLLLKANQKLSFIVAIEILMKIPLMKH